MLERGCLLPYAPLSIAQIKFLSYKQKQHRPLHSPQHRQATVLHMPILSYIRFWEGLQWHTKPWAGRYAYASPRLRRGVKCVKPQLFKLLVRHRFKNIPVFMHNWHLFSSAKLPKKKREAEKKSSFTQMAPHTMNYHPLFDPFHKGSNFSFL